MIDDKTSRDGIAVIRSLPYITAAIAGRHGIRVLLDARNGTASTDGKVIRLPALPIPKESADPDEVAALADMAYGYVFHEIGHIKVTDFEVYKAAGEEGALRVGLLNCIEDPWQEQANIRAMPGLQTRLDAVFKRLCERGRISAPETDWTPGSILQSYCMLRSRGVIRKQAQAAELADEGREAMDAVFGPVIAKEIDTLLIDEGPRINSTADALALADAIIARVKGAMDKARKEAAKEKRKEKAKQKAEKESGDGDQGDSSGDDGDQGDSSGNGGDQGDSSGDDGDQGGSSGNGGDQGDSSGDGGDQGDSSGDGGDQGDSSGNGGDQGDQAGSGSGGGSMPTAKEQADALKKALNAKKAIEDTSDLIAEAMKEAVQDLVRSGETEGSVEDDADGSRAGGADHQGSYMHGPAVKTNELAGVIAQIRRRLAAEFQGRARAQEIVSKRGRMIAGSALHRVAMDDSRIFQKRIEGRAVNAAVGILLDRSGSMSGVIDMANAAVFTAAAGLEAINGVKTCVGVFPDVSEMSRWDDRSMARADKFTAQAVGCTPLHSALLWMGRKIIARPETRKVLVVATDGAPDNHTAALAQIHALEEMGVLVVGIGIMTNAVERLFRNHGVINSVEELPEALVSAVRNQLVA